MIKISLTTKISFICIISFFTLIGCKKKLEEPVPASPSALPIGDPTGINQRLDNENSVPVNLSIDKWGINGAPFTPVQPYYCPISDQAKLIKELGMSWYRAVVWLDPGFFGKAGGIANNPKLNASDFRGQVMEFKDRNVNILPILMPLNYENWVFEEKFKVNDQLTVSFTKTELEDKGELIGENFARQTYLIENNGLTATGFGNIFHYYEVGNEDDAKILIPTKPVNDIKVHEYDIKGGVKEDYDKEKAERLMHYLRGVCKGIKKSDPSAKIIINSSHGPRKGYFQYLKDFSVDYDIIGYHWYSLDGGKNPQSPEGNRDNQIEMVNDLAKMTNFKGEPLKIWLTEINRQSTKDVLTYSSEDDNEQRDYFKTVFKQLESTSAQAKASIEGFFVHKLFNDFGLQARGEENYGVAFRNPYFNPADFEYSLKPVFQTLKYKIEQTNYGWESYIYGLFKYALQRKESDIKITSEDTWVKSLKAAKEPSNKDLLVNFLKDEFYTQYIKEQYLLLLDKEPPADVLNTFLNGMKSGASMEDVTINLCLIGGEFMALAIKEYNLNPSTATVAQKREAFIKRLYDRLNNRKMGDNGVAPLLGFPEGEIVYKLIAEKTQVNINFNFENRQMYIAAQFLKYLGRVPNESGRNYYLNKLLTDPNYNRKEFIYELLESEEFWVRVISEGYNRRNLYNQSLQSDWRFPFNRAKFDPNARREE